VAFNVPQLTQASFLQKKSNVAKCFLISVTVRWHRASVACKKVFEVDYFDFSCKRKIENN
jgi:hypothetical protein